MISKKKISSDAMPTNKPSRDKITISLMIKITKLNIQSYLLPSVVIGGHQRPYDKVLLRRRADK